MPEHLSMDDREIHAWLDNPKAKTAGDREPNAPSDGWRAVERAIEEASTHPCDPDRRTFNMLVYVLGGDGRQTIRSLEPHQNLQCVLGVLRSDPEVYDIRVLGVDRVTLPDISAPEGGTS